MKLEYLPDLTGGRRLTQVVSESLVRLYDFDAGQSLLLVDAIEQQVLEARKLLALASLPLIEPINCDLTLVLATADQGLVPSLNSKAFTCYLTETAYRQVISMMQNVGDGHQWLNDVVSSGVDWLYSPGGTW